MNYPTANPSLLELSSEKALRQVLKQVSHFQPAQGPISVFIHHNTLHAFEHLSFDEALVKAGEIFGCEPYLNERRLHDERAKGRITDSDLLTTLIKELGAKADDEVAPSLTRYELQKAMLLNLLWQGTPQEVRWKLSEIKVHETNADLWQGCQAIVAATPEGTKNRPYYRHRDWVYKITSQDTDQIVNDVLIKYTAAFLDQGVSHQPLPGREYGFLKGFCELMTSGKVIESWQKHLKVLCESVLSSPKETRQVILASLESLGVPKDEWYDFFTASVLALRGWGGMVHEVEQRPDRVHHPIPSGSWEEFLAVRLFLERAVLKDYAEKFLQFTGPLAELRSYCLARKPALVPNTDNIRAYLLFQVSMLTGLKTATASVLHEVEAFHTLKRRRIYHLAWERRIRTQTLDALSSRATQVHRVASPAFQVVTCIDEREESFRRHLEEIEPQCETYGAAGFFAVPMYYKGADEAHFVPLCPIVLTPKNWVTEKADENSRKEYERQVGIRAKFGRLSHRTHLGTRTPILGSVLAAFGAVASVPLVARILFPRYAGRIRGTAKGIAHTPIHTTLTLERKDEIPAGDSNGRLGFSPNEMADMSERLLRDIGLINHFAPLVFILGHGSSSLNNPHKSAYDCGACGGSPGAPNARAIAFLLNDTQVRATLAIRGIQIPEDTWFVGGCHNTCNDSVFLVDTERVPAVSVDRLRKARLVLNQACERNAHERSRRFESCPLDSSATEAHQHVEARSEDLAQARPELGHATNAVCLVGRRERSRGLFFDRRAFLVSYNPLQDTTDCEILARTLGAVFPVCGGINLEYLFSHVDPQGYGCGTKLPHNIASLLGVMDGASSDLRTGLPWQMTEIHEPVRLLIVIETTETSMRQLMNTNPAILGLVTNGWVQVALQHPHTAALSIYEDGMFVPYLPSAEPVRRVRTSQEWYGGKRDHLDFVEISARQEGSAA